MINWRVPVAFAISPVLPCALLGVIGIILHPERTGARLLFAYEAAVAEVLILLVAAPAYLILRRYRVIAVLECLLAGFAIGALASAIVLFAPRRHEGDFAADAGGPTVVNGHMTWHGVVSNLEGIAIFALLGTSIGLMFWLVGIRRPHRKDVLH
jgi:hypothetical protein